MSFPGAFGVNPTDDLKLYMRNVQLPLLKLPPNSPYLPQDSDHTHQNFLNVAFGDHRRLEQMQKLDGSLMSRAEDIRSYFNKIVTDGDVGAVERATDRPFSVPSKGFQVREPIRPPPVTARKFGEWVESGPLQTAQNMAHCIFSEMDDYMFLPEVDSVNGKIMDTFVWTTLPNKPGQHAFLHSKMSLTIFVQPPWILSPRDMLSFCELHSLPQDLDESKIASKHRLWATIYDQCIMRKCQYFVLTNYSNWVFGVFTAGFTKGYICASARFDSSDPTVIELLLYWIASAIRDEGAFVPPQVGPPDEHLTRIERPCRIIDVLVPRHERAARALALIS